MIIKLPACYDVSHWKEIFDFKSVSPVPLLFITKATEAYPGSGYNHTDSKFIHFALGMLEINVTRGFYHFFRKSFNAYTQANHFISVISQIDILQSDILILDVEEGGETASQLWAFIETVKKAYPDNLILIYSRKNILDAIKMTESEKTYFRKIKIWTAGYPWFPDLFNSIPSGYIPDTDKYGEAVLWQYSAHGRVAGITTELGGVTDTDLNFITESFNVYLEMNKTILGDKIMTTFEGKAKELAKVWNGIGGARVYPDVLPNQLIKADAEQTASGIKYIHLTSPTIGWSKASWFDYRPVIVTDPEPDPGPEPTTKKIVKSILTYDDGSTEELYPIP